MSVWRFLRTMRSQSIAILLFSMVILLLRSLRTFRKLWRLQLPLQPAVLSAMSMSALVGSLCREMQKNKKKQTLCENKGFIFLSINGIILQNDLSEEI